MLKPNRSLEIRILTMNVVVIVDMIELSSCMIDVLRPHDSPMTVASFVIAIPGGCQKLALELNCKRQFSCRSVMMLDEMGSATNQGWATQYCRMTFVSTQRVSHSLPVLDIVLVRMHCIIICNVFPAGGTVCHSAWWRPRNARIVFVLGLLLIKISGRPNPCERARLMRSTHREHVLAWVADSCWSKVVTCNGCLANVVGRRSPCCMHTTCEVEWVYGALTTSWAPLWMTKWSLRILQGLRTLPWYAPWSKPRIQGPR